MNRFAALIDRLATVDGDMKQRIIADYLASTPKPDGTLAIEILAARRKPRRVKLALVRGLAEARLDPVLYKLSLDYVGDVAETIALLWPPQRRANRDPTLSEVIEALSTLGRSELPKRVEAWLDACDANGRWALIKLITGTLVPQSKAPGSNASQNEMFKPAAPTSGTIDAVALYVESGKSKSSPLTCTFGLWRDGVLVPVGKAVIAAGGDAERLAAFARDNATNRFGPVREIAPAIVLEIGFDELHASRRHKSGVVLRNARVAAIRWDKTPDCAAALENLVRLLPAR